MLASLIDLVLLIIVALVLFLLAVMILTTLFSVYDRRYRVRRDRLTQVERLRGLDWTDTKPPRQRYAGVPQRHRIH